MAIRELAELTWEEVRDLDRGQTVAVLPVGAMEAHGPHLPLATDVVIAEAMARAGASRIAAQGMVALLLPPLPSPPPPSARALRERSPWLRRPSRRSSSISAAS